MPTRPATMRGAKACAGLVSVALKCDVTTRRKPGAKKGSWNRFPLPFCLLPSAPASWFLPSRCVDLCLRDDFEEPGLFGQLVEPLLEARAQLFARQESRVAVRRDDSDGRRRGHTSQSAFDEQHVAARETLRRVPLREGVRESASALRRLLIFFAPRQRVERDGEVRAEHQERAAVDRKATLHQRLDLLRQLRHLPRSE